MSNNQTNQAPTRPKTMVCSKRSNRNRVKDEPKRQFTPRKRISECEDDGTCDLCALTISIYAIGHCDHPICYRCSAKMRILCEQTHCAVCRVDMKKVIYSKSKRKFKDANDLKLMNDGNNNWFTDEIVKNEYKKLFKHGCTICKDREPDVSFEKLQAHVRKEHAMFFCEICVKHNKNFTDECKTYTREKLGRHRRLGDEDDTSHRGHPLCEFCDERYLDNDNLLRHLRTDHYFCHFCDDSGSSHQYYNEYRDLRAHYKSDHFLCEEDDCINEQFTSVFGNELDLKAHRATAHSGMLTRQQQKVERNIDLGFQYARPPRRGGRGAGVSSDDYSDVGNKGRGRGRGRGNFSKGDEDIELAKALSLSDTANNQENNGEGGKRSKPTVERPRVRTQAQERRTSPQEEEEPQPPNLEDDFPTLGVAKEKKDEPASLYTYSSIQKEKQGKSDGPEVEKLNPAQQKPSQLSAANRVASAYGRSTGTMSQEDFPSLSSSGKGVVLQSAGIWSSSSTPMTNGHTKPIQKKSVPQPVSVNMPTAYTSRRNVNIKSDNEFPSLGGDSAAPVGTGVRSIWGQVVPVPSAPTRKSKPKTPVASTNQKKTTGNPDSSRSKVKSIPHTDSIIQDDTMAIRFGSTKHGMRIATSKHAEAITDIERPIEVPGTGATSVKTVTPDAFRLLSGSGHGQSAVGSGGEASLNFNSQETEFPELGGGTRRNGRIKGIGSSRSNSGAPSWGNSKSNTRPSKKQSFSLADISNDIFPSGSLDSVPLVSNKKVPAKHKKETKEEPSATAEISEALVPTSEEKDFSTITKAPPLSSYSANWHEDNVRVSDRVANESNFMIQGNDFPSLGGGSETAGKSSSSSKKNKKKKKNKKVQDVSDLSKHFTSVDLEGGGSEGHADSGQLNSLLKVHNGNVNVAKGLASIFKKEDENSVEESSNNGDTGSHTRVKLREEIQQSMEEIKEKSDEEKSILGPRPDSDDVRGRNVWLIEAIKQLCDSEEKFSDFKISSAQFRQESMSASPYYHKCRILLGDEYFDMVFNELVDLLPDEDKRSALLRVHNNFTS